MGYELLENDLTDSTLWMYRSDQARILAITIISKCNGSDRVYVSPAVLFERARLTPDQGSAALAELMSPDTNSKCQLEEGRFVVQKVDEYSNRYLWLPSYKGRRIKYLAKVRKQEQRDREAEANRLGESRSVTVGHGESQNVSPDQKQIRAEAEKKENTGESARFVPPKVEEVEAYAHEKGLVVDAAYFVDFFEAKGWVTGKTKMRSWRAAARNAARDGWTTRHGKPTPPAKVILGGLGAKE